MAGNLDDVSLEFFADDGQFPNSVLPVIVYRHVVDAPSAEVMEQLLDANDWPSQWRDGVFDYHHYHSTAHECLAVASGSAALKLGGPQGRVIDVVAGDVLVLPAGTAHQRLSASNDLLIVGAYPPGQDWDTCKGLADERPAADQRIAKVPLPTTDPVGGSNGPVLAKWA